MTHNYVPERLHLLTILDGLISIEILGISSYYIDYYLQAAKAGEGYSKWPLVAALFFLMFCSETLGALLCRKHNRVLAQKKLIFAITFLLCTPFLLIGKHPPAIGFFSMTPSFPIVSLIYWLGFCNSRILSMLQSLNPESIIVNVLWILMVGALLLISTPILLVGICTFEISIHVVYISLRRVNLRVLHSIIQKTYATEILFGIFIFTLTFSLILPHIESSIDSFWDGLWYCFSIVTTIGFGDITVSTPIGRIMSVILGFYGIIVVSVITSIVVNFYNETKEQPPKEPYEQEPYEEPPYEEQLQKGRESHQARTYREQHSGSYEPRPKSSRSYEARPKENGEGFVPRKKNPDQQRRDILRPSQTQPGKRASSYDPEQNQSFDRQKTPSQKNRHKAPSRGGTRFSGSTPRRFEDY